VLVGLQVHSQIPKEHITVMDDNSSDHSRQVALKHEVRFVTFGEHIGLSQLIRRSLRESLDSGFDYHITIDGDGQHEPAYVPGIIDVLESFADMVVNSRYHPDSEIRGELPLDRQLLNIQTAAVVQRLTGLGLTDPLCGLRGYRREVTSFLLEQDFVTDRCPDPHGFVLESLLRVWHSGRFRIVELPHPAIYNGNGKIAKLYNDEYLEQRLERSLLHARHLVLVMRSLGLNFAAGGNHS